MKKQDDGFIVATILITVFMVVLMAIAILSLSVANNQNAAREQYRINAQFAADAGLDIGIQSLNSDSDWAGATETVLYQDSKMKSTYTTTIVNGATDSKKTIKTTARVYVPATASAATVTRIYELDVEAVTSGIGLTSVVSGVGGLTLNNNAKITGGDVVVNGTVSVGNNAQIGLSTTNNVTNPEKVINVRVAHTNCPVPATSAYPRTCGTNENGEPITIIGNGVIYADVRATNQTIGTQMLNPGLVPNQTIAPYTMPTYDRNQQKSNVTDTKTQLTALLNAIIMVLKHGQRM